MRSQFPSALRIGALLAALAGVGGTTNSTRRNTFTAKRPQTAESQQFYRDRAITKRARKARILEARADAGAIRRHVLKGEIIPPEPTKAGKPRAKKAAA